MNSIDYRIELLNLIESWEKDIECKRSIVLSMEEKEDSAFDTAINSLESQIASTRNCIIDLKALL